MDSNEMEVTQNSSSVPLELQRATSLFLIFRSIWLEKWTKNIDDTCLSVALRLWGKAIKNLSDQQIEAACDHCMLNLEWPPSICEFLQVCENLSGMPSAEEIMQAGIRRDFNNPIVKRIYDAIGSWDFHRDTTKDLLSKIKRECDKIRNDFRTAMLEDQR